MHLDTRPRTYRAVDGSVREYRQVLLRRSYRNDAGKPAKYYSRGFTVSSRSFAMSSRPRPACGHAE
jgi:hypothetical protein